MDVRTTGMCTVSCNQPDKKETLLVSGLLLSIVHWVIEEMVCYRNVRNCANVP